MFSKEVNFRKSNLKFFVFSDNLFRKDTKKKNLKNKKDFQFTMNNNSRSTANIKTTRSNVSRLYDAKLCALIIMPINSVMWSLVKTDECIKFLQICYIVINYRASRILVKQYNLALMLMLLIFV